MSDQLFVYNFHRISDEISPAYPPMPVKVFERLIQYLNNHYLIIPQEALFEEKTINTNKPLLILSFDDAYFDFYENAWPILDKYNLPASLHIITQCAQSGETFWTQKLNKTIESYFFSNSTIKIEELNYFAKINSINEIEKVAIYLYKKLLYNDLKNDIISSMQDSLNQDVVDTKMMTWNELRLLPKDSISFGSHTHTHCNLANLSDVEVYNELKTSFDLIIDELGVVPMSVAYPNGQFNDKTESIAKDVGYKLQYTVCNRINHFTKQNNQKLLHRYNLYNIQFWKNWIKLQMYKYF